MCFTNIWVSLCDYIGQHMNVLDTKIQKRKKVIGKKTPRYTIFQCPRKCPQIHSQNPSHMLFISVVCKILLLLLPLLLHLCPDTQFSVIFCLNVKPYPCLICVYDCVYIHVQVWVYVCAHFSRMLSNSFLGLDAREYILCTGQRSSSPKPTRISGTCLRRKCTDRQFFFI